MAILLLILIYVAFISLGLPDTLVGAIWPLMQSDFNVPLWAAGLLSMITAIGTIVSSLLSSRFLFYLGTGKTILFSVLMTAIALYGFSITENFLQLCLWAFPLGVGAGAIDVALNNFVALYYKAKHMNWLHSFWGIGATTGPFIMALVIGTEGHWQSGYQIISFLQLGLTLLLLLSLPLWKTMELAPSKREPLQKKLLSNRETLRLNGAFLSLLFFVGYAALEITTGLWSGTYLVRKSGFSSEEAAFGVSLMFAFITFGRFLSGFLTAFYSNRQMIRFGLAVSVIGVFVLLVPLPSFFDFIGIILIGFGCAPIYPAMLHETPKRFGVEHSQSVIALGMAGFYVGALCMPPAFGVIADLTAISYLPVFLIFFIIFLFVVSEKLNRLT